MHIKTKTTRRGTFYIVCTVSGAEIMHFSRKDRAEAWMRNETYA